MTRTRGAPEQLREPGELAQRVEIRIDPEPTGGEEVRSFQQRFQLIHGLLVFTGQDVDPSQQVLIVGPAVRVLAEGLQGQPVLALADRIRLAARIRQHQAVEQAQLRVVRGVSELCLVPDAPGIGVGPRAGLVAPISIGLRYDAAPDSAVVIELPR